MKKQTLILILACFSSFAVIASSNIVNQISNYDDFEGVFKITNTKSTNYHYVLDCQSYFNKLDLFDQNNQLQEELFISSGECAYLWENINQCITDKGSKCLNSGDIFNSSCSCF